jgi:hypothetical protein
MKKLLVVVVVFTSSIFIIGGFSKSFAATIYYVSFSGGNDSYAGTSTDKPFKTMTKVNGLNLTAGDQVLFQCGDTWQGVDYISPKPASAAIRSCMVLTPPQLFQ